MFFLAQFIQEDTSLLERRHQRYRSRIGSVRPYAMVQTHQGSAPRMQEGHRQAPSPTYGVRVLLCVVCVVLLFCKSTSIDYSKVFHQLRSSQSPSWSKVPSSALVQVSAWASLSTLRPIHAVQMASRLAAVARHVAPERGHASASSGECINLLSVVSIHNCSFTRKFHTCCAAV